MDEKVVHVMPAPFPGFDDLIIDVTPPGQSDADNTTVDEDAAAKAAAAAEAEAEAQASGEGTGEPEQRAEEEQATGEEQPGSGQPATPVQLDDNASYIHPVTGQEITGKDLRNEVMMRADYSRKTEALAPFSKQMQLYMDSPKFREGVDRLGAEILGFDAPEEAPDPRKLTAEEKAEWNQKFDEDPFSAQQEYNDTFGRADEPQRQGPSPAQLAAASMQDKADLLFAQARAHLGGDWAEVEKRIMSKAPNMGRDEWHKYNTNPYAMHELIYSTHREFQAERAQAVDGTKTKNQDAAARAGVTDTGGSPSEVVKKKGVWDEKRTDFLKKVERIKSSANHHSLI
jgi:hypothetical protein